jgi:hypothetical protein
MAIKEEEQKKNGMKIVDNMDGEKSAEDKLNMKVAKLTNMQKSVLKLKRKNSQAMGEPIKIEDIMNDPVFKTIGDKKKPATKEEIQEFLNK